jgi:hypothetical protein
MFYLVGLVCNGGRRFTRMNLPPGSSRADQRPRQPPSASRRHDVPNTTSDVPSATSNPNDGDGYACDDAGTITAGAASATPGAILQQIVVKPATATAEPGRISARKMRRLIAPTVFTPLSRALSVLIESEPGSNLLF